jgi:hypothetical protein
MFGMGRERRRMHERWMQMTPEQREQFVQQRRGGFGRHGHCHHRDERYGEPRADGGHSSQTPEDNGQKPTQAE